MAVCAAGRGGLKEAGCWGHLSGSVGKEKRPERLVAGNPTHEQPADAGGWRIGDQARTRVASRAAVCAAPVTASLSLMSGCASPSAHSVGGLRTFGMAWTQNLKTNSLSVLVSSSPAWKTDAAKGQTEWNACGSERGPEALLHRKAPSPGWVLGGRVVSPSAVSPSVASPSRLF